MKIKKNKYDKKPPDASPRPKLCTPQLVGVGAAALLEGVVEFSLDGREGVSLSVQYSVIINDKAPIANTTKTLTAM